MVGHNKASSRKQSFKGKRSRALILQRVVAEGGSVQVFS